ncbi:type VII secretion protein EccB [Micromonospora pattaloongensis]|uniref:Type VII secretion protein EccB n=1 Tax=Micromonospora pattaloongensis TaxID=405436 RepID=A0A1H3SDX6_9ACTN|nr:type VII secretion protein EccB [Micromonospora pattaloongensis]SDZ35908.1 type VII secretion protein EccB [Micromonospora pattaloongensis]
MPSRQDQLHSYQFMVQRVVAALVMRETDPPQSPFQRAAGATLASVLIAAIAIGGVAVYGALVGGGATNWRDPNAVIVEEESGARYVYRDEKLHPVLNYASALLIVGSPEPRTVRVSAKSIEGVTRGTPLGIVDAPDALPAADRLAAGPWTICSLPAGDGGRATVRSALLVGAAPTGGEPLGDDGVLARHPDGSLYLIWHNRRHLLRDRDIVLDALAWTNARALPVAPALLNALPAGADLARIPIVDEGQPSAAVPDATIGEVFVVESQGGGRQFAVAQRDGLAGITQVQADLLITALGGQSRPTPLSQGRFNTIEKLPELVPSGAAAPPASTPKLAETSAGAVCGQVRDDGGVFELRVGAAAPDVTNAPRTGARSAEGGALADHVVVAPGRGAVVEAAAAPGATGGAISVVTDLGRRYAVAGGDVLATLGYGGVKPLRLPASLVALVPAGRALDPAAARAPAPQS